MLEEVNLGCRIFSTILKHSCCARNVYRSPCDRKGMNGRVFIKSLFWNSFFKTCFHFQIGTDNLVTTNKILNLQITYFDLTTTFHTCQFAIFSQQTFKMYFQIQYQDDAKKYLFSEHLLIKLTRINTKISIINIMEVLFLMVIKEDVKAANNTTWL